MRWRVLPNPVATDGAPVVLDGSAGLLAIRLAAGFAVDLLVASGPRAASSGTARTSWAGAFAGPWQQVPADADADVALRDLVLVPSVGSGASSPARLLRVDGGELRTFGLGDDGTCRGMGHRVRAGATGPDLGQPVAMAPVQRAATQGGTALITRTSSSPPRTARCGSVGSRDARRPRDHLDAVVQRARAPAPTSAPPPPSIRSRTVSRSSGWRGPTSSPGSLVGWGRPTASAATAAMPGPAGFDAAPGSSLRVAAQPWAPSTTQPLTTAVASRQPREPLDPGVVRRRLG